MRRSFSALMALIFFLSLSAECWSLSQAEEEKLGRQVLVQLNHQGGFVADKVLTGFVEQVGQTLARQAESLPFKPSFHLIDDRQINAFAAPGGVIVITTGLIKMMDSVDELAGVLAHELAHSACRHLAERMKQAQKIGLATMAAVLAGVVLGVAGGEASLGQAVTLGGMAAGASAQLAYSRGQELEADQIGEKTMQQAGYSPAGAVSILEKLNRAQISLPAPPVYLLTHPAISDRIAFLKNLAQEGKPRPDRFGASDFKWFAVRLAARSKDEASVEVESGPPADYGLGLIYLSRGRDSEALERLARAFEAAPEALGTAVGYAEALRRTGQPSQAAQILKTTLARRPDDQAVLLLLGQIYLDLNQLQEAHRALEELDQLSADDPQILHTLGVVLGRMGRLVEAHTCLARSYLLRGQRAKALSNFELALKYARTEAERQKIAERQREALEYLPSPPR